MFDTTETRHAALTMLGGALWSVVLALDDVAPGYVGLAVVVPVLVGFGVLEIYGRYRAHYGSAGRAGVLLTGLGLAALLIAVLLYAVLPPNFVVIALVAVPGVTGLAALVLGSALLATALYRLGVLGAPAAALLGLGVPLTPLVGALLAAVVGPDAPLGPIAPPGVVTGLSGLPYGVGWMLVGYRLREGAGRNRVAVDGRSPAPDVSPHLVVTTAVGVALVLLSAGQFLPLGPLSGTPWVGRSPVLDAWELLVGAAGVAVGVSRNRRAARTYGRVAGPLSLAVVALTLLGFVGVPGPEWLAGGLLDLNVADILLHLPAGAVLVAVGVGVDGEVSADGEER